MPVSRAQQKATAKYESKVYDKTLLRLPKGKLEEIKGFLVGKGESVNGFINRAISETIQRDTGAPTDAQQPAAQVAETTQDGRQLLEVYGYDPLAEKSLAVDIRTQERYIVEPVPVEKPVLSDYDNDDSPF